MLTIYTYPNNPRVSMAQIAGKYNGIEIEVPAFEMGVTNKTEEFLAMNPMGKVPCMKTPEGALFESQAIARYVARLSDTKNIYPKEAFAASEVDQWLDFCCNEINLPFSVWLYPIFGFIPYNRAASERAKTDADRALTALNTVLRKKTFLVGERVTLADIVLVCALLRPFTMVIDPAAQKKYGNVTRWFNTCLAQAEFKAVLGDVELCEKEKLPEMPGKEGKKGGKPEKKEQSSKKVKETKEKEVKELSAEEAAEAEEKKESKAKNPLDLLPPSKMELDEWKRVYSNNETRPVANPKFWEMYDKEGYSLWFCSYKYNSELSKTFMTSNLVSGWLSRSDRVRKYAFANILVLGEDGDLAIAGVWLFRGTEIPQVAKDVDDYDLYNWRQVDVDSKADRELVENYWAWDGDLNVSGAEAGKACADGKTFK